MTKWKRKGLIVIKHRYDHKPEHVHVFQDGKSLLKFDTQKWQVLSGQLTPQARKVLEELREEKKI